MTLFTWDGKGCPEGRASPDPDRFPAPWAISLERDECEPLPPFSNSEKTSESQGAGNPRSVRRDDAHQGSQDEPATEESGGPEGPPSPTPGQNADAGLPGREPKEVQGAA